MGEGTKARRHGGTTGGLLVLGVVVAGGVVSPVAASGADVIVAEVSSTLRWASDAVETSYSFGLRICNAGDADVAWRALPARTHPLKAQNLYRLSSDGRFEQIGMAWPAHGVCALQQTDETCGTCAGPGGCLPHLAPGCSSPNTAAAMGGQSGLSPRAQVNPHTGDFAYPWNAGEGTAGPFRRRVRVRNADLDPAANPGARYFAEHLLVAADDAAAANQNDNASFREVTAAPGTFGLTLAGPTHRGRPALEAWADADPEVTLAAVQIDADGQPDPDTGRYDDGRLVVGARATARGDGTWQYEYALYNMNAHRAAASFTIPVPPTATVSAVGFHDVAHHSGDGIGGVNFDDTDWTPTRDASGLTWATDPFETDENANALRWGTLYNVRFIADTAPGPAVATIGVFRPGVPMTVTVAVVAPVGASCPADLDGDGGVGVGDLLAVLAAWGPCPPEWCPADLDGNGRVDVADLVRLLSAWGPCV